MKKIRERIPASLGTFTQVSGGVRMDWGVDDLDYGARYLVGRGIPFEVEGPPEFRAALRRLAKEANQRASSGGQNRSPGL